jgi:AraC-like DNA-binding protein
MKIKYKFKPILVTQLNQASHKFRKGDWKKFRPHHHDKGHYEIIFIDYGNTFLQLGKRHLHLKSGQCIIIPGNIEHEFEPELSTPLNFLNIMFCGNLPDSLLNTPLSVSSTGYEVIRKFSHEVTMQQQYCNELACCLLTEFLVLLFRQVSKPDATGEKLHATPSHPGYSQSVKRALNIIAEQYSQPLVLDQVARASGISIPHLRKLLKQETGKSFSVLLHDQRIIIAKHLLTGPDNFTIQEIANMVGYSSSSFFFKIFKRIAGMTPGECVRSIESEY